VEKRRRLAETETKRLAAMGQVITAERTMILLAAIVSVIRDHVKEPQVMQGISRDIQKLIHKGE
jgi:hypothetical protein